MNWWDLALEVLGVVAFFGFLVSLMFYVAASQDVKVPSESPDADETGRPRWRLYRVDPECLPVGEGDRPKGSL